MEKLKIIIVLYELPHPFSRSPSRWYHVLLRELAKDGHKVVCFYAYENEIKDQVAESLKIFDRWQIEFRVFPFPQRNNMLHKVKTFLKPYSHYFSRDFIEELKKELKKGYDILHIEQNPAGYLGLGHNNSLVSIHHLMCLDLEYSVPKGLKEKFIRHQMFRRERSLISKYKNIRVLTERLKNKVSEFNSSANIFTLPLAIDYHLYPMTPFQKDNKIFGMIGSILWPPGYSAAVTLIEKIFPKVKQRVKDAKLFIAGWHAEKKLSHYKNDDIIIAGDVKSPDEFFSRASVLVYCPERGSGMKVKIMESMLYGVPVVTNSEGVEGLDVENGVHCFFDDNIDKTVDNIVELLNNNELRMQIRINARKLMEEKYSPQAIMPKMYEIYDKVRNS